MVFFGKTLLFLSCLLLPVWLGAASGRPARDRDPGPLTPETRIPLVTVARVFGFSRVTEDDRTLELSGRLHTLRLEKGGRRALLNGLVIWLQQPVLMHEGRWTLAQVDVATTLGPVLNPLTELRGLGDRIVVLDPGHGGSDPGAIAANGLTEKEVCLDISLRVRRHLQAAGYTVFLTRHQDQFLSLEERTRRARTWQADVFVSIHANASSNAAAAGVETFALAVPGQASTNHFGQAAPSQIVHPGNRFDPANMALAFALQQHLVEAVNPTDRGVRRARFSVLRDAPAPAALVEVGFLSNPREAALLGQAAHRERIALAIARGIDAYLREVRRAALAP